jgi:uncharacterized membrane protein YbaN (DUF454 family)
MGALRRTGVLTVALLCLLLGVAGVLLPVLPGLPLLALALVLLATEFVWARRLLDRVRVRFPVTASILDRITPRGD